MYVIVNTASNSYNGHFVCEEEPETYFDLETALDRRDELRNNFNNPGIEVFELHEEPVTRDTGN